MSVKSYALYNTTTGLIENNVYWDQELNPNVTWQEGCAVVSFPEIENSEGVTIIPQIGWSYINGQFLEPIKQK